MHSLFVNALIIRAIRLEADYMDLTTFGFTKTR